MLSSLWAYGVLPGYGVCLAYSVRKAHRRTTAPHPAPRRPAPFWRHYLKNCACFPLVCLALIGTLLIWPDRVP